MAGTTTCVFRVSLAGEASIWRDVEIESSKSLYQFAEGIVRAFDFDFDHAFGFYTGLTESKMWKTQPKYELFADMGDAESDAKSVKKTSIETAFPKDGHKMLFMFDYGDNWLFRVQRTGAGRKAAKTRYPRVIASEGASPEQYPDYDEANE